MKDLTTNEIKNSLTANNIKGIAHHDCSLCGTTVGYLIEDDNLFFDSSCDCSSYRSNPRLCNWDELANHHNRQTNQEVRTQIAESYGLLANLNN